MFSEKQIVEIVDLLSKMGPDTKVYFGCDSKVIKKGNQKFAKYATVCIIHMNGKNGCRLFSHKSTEKCFDQKSNKPKMRMITEAMKVCELYLQLIGYIDEFDVEVHLDINTDPKHASQCAATEAAGYVLGMTGIHPKMKPHSWAAGRGADKVVRNFQ